MGSQDSIIAKVKRFPLKPKPSESTLQRLLLLASRALRLLSAVMACADYLPPHLFRLVPQFQNRRNRKGRKTSKAEPTTPPPTHASSPDQTFTPSSPPTRDFTLSEKKRKSYGALGRSPPDYTHSDSDPPSLHLKKPRLPRASSGVSDVSTSSVEYSAPFTAWSSPSSRSTSSSSISSSPSDGFGSPSKAPNVFKYINPLKYDVRARSAMPSVTIATPPQGFQSMAQGEKSPYASDQQGSAFSAQQNTGPAGLASSGLQLNTEAFDRELRESIQQALELSASSQCSSRNVSSSSWGSQQTTTDDDGWVDEDEFDVGSGGRHNTPVDGAVVNQLSLGLPSFQGMDPTSIVQSLSQIQPPQPTAQAQPDSNGNTSADTSFSYSATADVDVDTFDLSQFFESAAIPTGLPSSSPFVPHAHHSPAQPTTNLPNAAGLEGSGSCFDLEVEMTDIQEYLAGSFLAPSLPSSQNRSENASGEVGMVEGGAGEGMVQGGEGAAQFYLNFDLTSEMLSLV